MSLLSFQKPAVAACIKHIYSKERIKCVHFHDWCALSISAPSGIDASVSSGKSLMIAHLAEAIKNAGNARGNIVRILVIQNQSELCSQNSEAAWSIGLKNSVYSAGLGRKSVHYEVIYATVGTIYRALDNEFSNLGFDLILVDEGHQCPYDEPESMYMQVISHFYKLKNHMRVIMFSGSWFRGADSIIGDFWQKSLTMEPTDPDYPEGGQGNGKITTEWMQTNGWVVPAIFGWPELEDANSYAKDFASLVANANHDFSEEELDSATSDLDKLVRIMSEVVEVANDRRGVLVFCATQKHVAQVKKVLVALGVHSNDVGIVTDKTPKKERVDILARAKRGKCKYVLNVSVLTTGINITEWDTLVYLRPIGSLVLLIQSIGRVLRLLLEEGGPGMVEMDTMSVEERLALIAASPKPNALVLDYAGVFDRLGEQYENPILEQAQKEHSARKGDLITCPVCQEMNSMYARRCIGIDHNGTRCEHFFQSKDCPDCGIKNDIVARECRNCGRELINPNEILTNKHYSESELTPVVSMKMDAGANGNLVVRFVLSDGREPYLIFYPNAGASPASIKVNQKVWWNGFVVPHIPPGEFRNKAYRMKADAVVKNSAWFNVPTHVAARFNEKTHRWVIGRRKFRDMAEMTVEGEE